MVSVLQTVDTSHEDIIHDVQLNYYGNRLATCSSDYTIKLFDVRGKQQALVATLVGHEGPVWQLSWAHPKFGSLLASCSYDKRVVIWRESTAAGGATSWSRVYEYSQHESSVNTVQWAPHEYGLMLACGSSDGQISVLTHTGGTQDANQWESVKITEAHSIGVNAVSWAPAVNQNALFNSTAAKQPLVKRFASGGCDSLVRIWRFNEEDGQWMAEEQLESHTDWVRDVAWAPSIGLPRQLIASCGQDGRVVVWSKEDEGGKWTSTVLHDFTDVVWHVSWSITGNILAVSGGGNKVTLWKENLDGRWVCLSDVTHGQGNISEQS